MSSFRKGSHCLCSLTIRLSWKGTYSLRYLCLGWLGSRGELVTMVTFYGEHSKTLRDDGIMQSCTVRLIIALSSDWQMESAKLYVAQGLYCMSSEAATSICLSVHSCCVLLQHRAWTICVCVEFRKSEQACSSPSMPQTDEKSYRISSCVQRRGHISQTGRTKVLSEQQHGCTFSINLWQHRCFALNSPTLPVGRLVSQFDN